MGQKACARPELHRLLRVFGCSALWLVRIPERCKYATQIQSWLGGDICNALEKERYLIKIIKWYMNSKIKDPTMQMTPKETVYIQLPFEVDKFMDQVLHKLR